MTGGSAVVELTPPSVTPASWQGLIVNTDILLRLLGLPHDRPSFRFLFFCVYLSQFWFVSCHVEHVQRSVLFGWSQSDIDRNYIWPSLIVFLSNTVWWWHRSLFGKLLWLLSNRVNWWLKGTVHSDNKMMFYSIENTCFLPDSTVYRDTKRWDEREGVQKPGTDL